MRLGGCRNVVLKESRKKPWLALYQESCKSSWYTLSIFITLTYFFDRFLYEFLVSWVGCGELYLANRFTSSVERSFYCEIPYRTHNTEMSKRLTGTGIYNSTNSPLDVAPFSRSPFWHGFLKPTEFTLATIYRRFKGFFLLQSARRLHECKSSESQSSDLP